MGKVKKTKAKTSKSKGSVASVATGAIGALIGGGSKSGGGKRRNRGPNYWANKVLVAKLKKKYYKLKYGGMR